MDARRLTLIRATLATKERFDGHQRQLAWFSRHDHNLYYDIAGLALESHNSYHRDGSVWRTSPATQDEPRKVDDHLELNEFEGWYKLGLGMIDKAILAKNPRVKDKHRNRELFVEIPMQNFPAQALNIVVELVESKLYHHLPEPPENARVDRLEFEQEPLVVTTILGHQENLLVKPLEDGFSVSHYNARYTANADGVDYSVEAYGSE